MSKIKAMTVFSSTKRGNTSNDKLKDFTADGGKLSDEGVISITVSSTARGDVAECEAAIRAQLVNLEAAGFVADSIKTVTSEQNGTVAAFGVSISKTAPLSEEAQASQWADAF
jgi:hypothetical protein